MFYLLPAEATQEQIKMLLWANNRPTLLLVKLNADKRSIGEFWKHGSWSVNSKGFQKFIKVKSVVDRRDSEGSEKSLVYIAVYHPVKEINPIEGVELQTIAVREKIRKKRKPFTPKPKPDPEPLPLSEGEISLARIPPCEEIFSGVIVCHFEAVRRLRSYGVRQIEGSRCCRMVCDGCGAFMRVLMENLYEIIPSDRGEGYEILWKDVFCEKCNPRPLSIRNDPSYKHNTDPGQENAIRDMEG